MCGKLGACICLREKRARPPKSGIARIFDPSFRSFVQVKQHSHTPTVTVIYTAIWRERERGVGGIVMLKLA